MNRLKKTLALLLCAAMALAVAPAFAMEADAADEVTLMATGTYYPDLGIWFDAGSGTVTDADESLSDAVTIPDKIDGVEVQGIGNYAFWNCGALTEIELPEGVQSIGDYAFQGCSELAGLVIPETVTHLGRHFIEGTAISSITVPKSVSSCGEYFGGPFAGCAGLTDITIEDGFTSIPDALLCGAEHIESVIIPETVRSIGKCAFDGCVSLKEINIPKSVTVIGQEAFDGCAGLNRVTMNFNDAEGFSCVINSYAFRNCGALTEIELPEGVQSIGDYAFQGCSELAGLVIPETVTHLGRHFIEGTAISSITVPKSVNSCGEYFGGPFAGCAGLTDITIEDGFTSIPDALLCGAEHIESVIIPETVRSIGKCAFDGCVSLKEINIPKSVTVIGQEAFDGCAGLNRVTMNFNDAEGFSCVINSSAFRNCGALTEVELPEGVQSIGDYAFQGCSELAGLVIPETVTNLGRHFIEGTAISSITVPKGVNSCGEYFGGPFAGCAGLTDITIEDGLAAIPDAMFCGAEHIESVIIPETVRSIGNYAFDGCVSLREINIPKAVSVIGREAFDGCANLNRVTMNFNDAEGFSCAIDDYAFRNCASLTELELPGTVTKLGRHFIEGTAISSITVPKSVNSCGEYYGGPFAGCAGLTDITIEDGLASIPNALLCGAEHIESVIIPETVRSIGNYAFDGCVSLKEINIPKAVSVIGREAFDGCTSLNRVTMNFNDAEGFSCAINESAFRNCGALTELELPESVTYLGEGFIENTAIESIKVPKSVTGCGYRPFINAKALTDVELEEGMTAIPAYLLCFYNSTSYVENVTIPDTVTSIGNYAFENCDGLTEITLPPRLESMGTGAFKDCDCLPEINIPATVTKIGDMSFQSCDGLRSVKFNENTDEEYTLSIGNMAFSECPEITVLTLPEGLTYLGHHFIEGTMISGITIPKTLKSVGYSSGGPLCGAMYLDDVYFEKGLTAIPRYMCESSPRNSHDSHISRVEIPDTVTSIGYGAFGNCAKLKKLIIPDSVEQIDGDIFYGTEGLVVQCSEASPAIEHIIDNDMQFQLTRDITSYDHLVYKNTDYYSDINSMTGYVPFRLNYRVKDGADIRGKEIVVRIPSNSALIESTLNVNGVIATNYEYEDNKLVIPVEENSGEIVFSVRPTEYDTLLTYAMLRFIENGKKQTEIIGVLNCSIPDVSIKTDTVTNSGAVTVEGVAPPSGKVEFYVDGEYVGETSAIKSGNYKTTITLPSLENYKRYTITAVATKDGRRAEASASIKYQEDVPALKSLIFKYGDHANTYEYDLTDGTAKPTIVFNPHLGLRFEAEFDNPDQIEEVYIVSTRSNQKKYMDAKWDAAIGKFVAEGLFDGTNTRYVPGEITVEYRKKAPKVEIKETLDSAELEVIRRNIDKRVLDSTVEVKTNTEDEFEASIYMPDELKELFGEEIKFTAKEIYKEYGDSDISDLMSAGKDIYSYFFEKDGKKYVFNYKLDDMDGEKINMILHDITGNKMVTWAVEAADKTKFQSVSGFLEKFNSVSGTIADIYEIESADEDLRDKIYASGMTPEQQAEALKKAEELKNDRYGFLAATMLITTLTASGVGAPALAFGLLFGAITTSSSFFWDLRMANILGTETGFSLKWCIDPSGYVYEAVDSNRVDGVTATAYWIASEFIGEDGSFDESNAVVWDAAEYAQLNPLNTDMNGAYAWDVPEGLWRVKFEKDGYETLVTDWLPVPPPQTDVNVGMVSTAAPAVAAELYANSLTLTFDKYMRPETVNNITVDGVSGVTVTPVDAEAAPDGTVYARSYSVGFGEGLIGGTVHTVSVAGAVSYAGTEMTPYSQDLTVVKAEITEAAAKLYGDVVRVSVSAENVPSGAVAYLAAYGADGGMLSLSNAKFVDGMASADIPAEGAERVKVLLWSNLSDMIPLCEAKEIEVTQ